MVLEKIKQEFPNCTISIMEKFNPHLKHNIVCLIFNGKHIPLVFTMKSFTTTDSNDRTGKFMINAIKHQIDEVVNQKIIDKFGGRLHESF